MSGPFSKENVKHLKQSLTLNFKNDKNLSLPTPSGLLTSPDLNMLEVNTPELENIILSNPTLATPTPTQSMLFQRGNITEEQAVFAGGFVEALNKLHNLQNGNNNNNNTNNNSSDNIFNSQHFMPLVKEEPQTVPNIPNSPSVSPVDMEYQERMKLERKRQRNRLAASKCRTRKLERISKLEDKVKQLKNENADLMSVLNNLKENVGLLKLEAMEHVKAGCPISINNF